MKLRTGISDTSNEHDAIYDLVGELGGLPLALEQAAAHIKSIKCSFSDYLERFKQKRIKLLRATSSKWYFERNADKLTVLTTWKLNIEYIHKQSEQEDLGIVPLVIMEIVSYLYADDIPIDIINSGEPTIDNTVLREHFMDSFCIKQAIEILCRFSLFQRNGTDALTVHRLVQEVIRNNIDIEKKKFTLQCATRMINKALHLATSPYKALESARKGVVSRRSLRMWSRLASNANTIKVHRMELVKHSDESNDFILNRETISLMQTTAIYNSLHQRNNIALEDQEQMLNIMTKLNLTAKEFKELISVKVPLLERDRLHIQNSVASLLDDEKNDKNKLSTQPLSVDTLRELGTKAFKDKQYFDALQYYTEAIRGSAIKTIDSKLLSNRSLVYFKINEYNKALEDANQCINVDPKNCKGHLWKAYAIARLIKEKEFSPEMKNIGLASACIAAHINETCQLEYKFKMYYPLLSFKTIENTECLDQEIVSLFDRPFTTLMLRRGRYSFTNLVITTKSIQVIGIEDGIEIDIGPGMIITRQTFVDFEAEPKIYIHFENVCFTEDGGQITVGNSGIASFYRCKFSNGKKHIMYYEENIHQLLGDGEITPEKYTRNEYSAIYAIHGGKLFLRYCTLNRCADAGIIVDGKGSLLDIESCEILNTYSNGILAGNGAYIKVVNNCISGHRTNGIFLGPTGNGDIIKNYITENKCEGIWCRGMITEHSLKDLFPGVDNGSKAHIVDNVICHNGLCGIRFDGGWYDVSRNKIYSNWLWGVAIQTRTAVNITDNEISANKCGGVRIGTNFSASVVIDGNTILDHSGPAICSLNPDVEVDRLSDLIPSEMEEVTYYSRHSIITNRNYFCNNNKPIQSPKDAIKLLNSCSFCTELSESLMYCGKCKIATYCSKDCQRRHWSCHKNLCTFLTESNIIQIDMKDTEANVPLSNRTFLPFLKGLFEGQAPNRMSSKRFIVKIQSDHEYTTCNPRKYLTLHDQSVQLDIVFVNEELYYLCSECGILAGTKLSAKKLFCWASFKNEGKILCIHTDKMPPFQQW